MLNSNRFKLRLARAWRINRMLLFILLALAAAWTFYPGSHALSRLSYDLPFVFKAGSEMPEVLIVAVENDDLLDLGLSPKELLPRKEHARLLQRLTQAGVKVVLYDVAFDAPGADPNQTRALADAIKAHGRVVLGGYIDAKNRRVQPPTPVLAQAAAGWGLLDLIQDPDDVVRRGYLKSKNDSASYAGLIAAELAGSDLARASSRKLWLNYYGPPGAAVFRCESLRRVLDPAAVSDASLTNKIVIVARRDELTKTDILPHPWSRWGVAKAWGDEIHATILANLLRGETMREMSALAQCLLGLGWLAAVCLIMPCFSRLTATWIWLAGTLGLIGCGIALPLIFHVWWIWTVPVLVGTVAFVWGLMKGLFTKGTVFISYRREDAALALWISAELKEAGYDAYMDLRGLRTGDRYDTLLMAELNSRETCIPIISPHTFPKVLDPEDFLIKELNGAQHGGKSIMPVLVSPFDWKDCMEEQKQKGIAQEMLALLRELATRQGARYHDDSGTQTIQQLVEGLSAAPAK